MKRTKGGGQIRQSQANATWSELDESLEMEHSQTHSQTQGCENFLSPRYKKPPLFAQSPSSALIPPNSIRGMMLLESRIGGARGTPQPAARSLPEGAVTFDRILSRKAKTELLSDNKLRELLEKLRTDDFVGTIDPEFHSSYLEDEIAPIPETLYRTPSEDDSLSDVSAISEDGKLSRRTSHSRESGIQRDTISPVCLSSSFSI
jgi:hypothetical protein